MIRPAEVHDLDAVLRLERAAFTAPHWPWAAYEQLLISSPDVERVLLVMTGAEGEILGFAGGSLVAGEAQLESIAVAAAARRQGLGRQLCEAFLKWSRGHGAAAAALEVRSASTDVQRLYRSLGFVPVGLRREYYVNPADDGILMRCDLDAMEEK